MIIESVLVSFILGIIRKGKFLNFGMVKIRFATFFIAGAVIQALLFKMATVDGSALSRFLFDHLYWIHLLSYVFILIPFVFNHNYKSLYVMGTGTCLNLLAILANGGQMPVALPEVYEANFDLGHILLTAETRLSFLSDVIFIGPPYPLPKIISVGDICIMVGVFYFIQQVMTDKQLTEAVSRIKR